MSVNRFGTNKSKLRFEDVKAELALRGMTISRSTASGGGSREYRVTFKLGPWLGMTAKKAEDCACYDDDLDSAFGTGVSMAMKMAEKVGPPRVRPVE